MRCQQMSREYQNVFPFLLLKTRLRGWTPTCCMENPSILGFLWKWAKKICSTLLLHWLLVHGCSNNSNNNNNSPWLVGGEKLLKFIVQSRILFCVVFVFLLLVLFFRSGTLWYYCFWLAGLTNAGRYMACCGRKWLPEAGDSSSSGTANYFW